MLLCFAGYVKTREAIAAEHSYPLSPLTYKVLNKYSVTTFRPIKPDILVHQPKCKEIPKATHPCQTPFSCSCFEYHFMIYYQLFQDVVLACGCSGALKLAHDVLLNPGDNVLLPKPGFSFYETLSISRGHEVRHYNLLVRNTILTEMASCFDQHLVNN